MKRRAGAVASPPGLLVLPLALLAALACGPQEAAKPPAPDPATLLESSAAALRAQTSFHFELLDRSDATIALPGLILLKTQGDWARPNRLVASFDLKPVDVTARLKMEMRILDRASYVSDPFSGKWSTVDADLLPVNFLDFGDNIAKLMLRLEAPRYEGMAKIGRRSFHRVSGAIAPAAFGILFYDVAREGRTSVEVLTDAGDGLPYQFTVRGRVLVTDPGDAERTLQISRFGLTVKVEPP
ncbi:MAG: LppX_LprAFG lipoprotein [Chloroflexi bacterium]|nr:LppX_LprAFG lipoprotein [Chloroflexota bacterium]